MSNFRGPVHYFASTSRAVPTWQCTASTNSLSSRITATQPSMIPLDSRLCIRRDIGAGESPTARASSLIGIRAFDLSKSRIWQSMWSIVLFFLSRRDRETSERTITPNSAQPEPIRPTPNDRLRRNRSTISAQMISVETRYSTSLGGSSRRDHPAQPIVTSCDRCHAHARLWCESGEPVETASPHVKFGKVASRPQPRSEFSDLITEDLG